MRRWALLLATMITALLGHPATAQAAQAGGLGLQIRGETGAPVITLTNNADTPCQVLTTSVGTVTLSNVRQGDRAIEAVPIVPNFDDDLGYRLGTMWRTIAPGESIDLAIPVVPVSAQGRALSTVSWTPLATLGALFEVDLGQPITMTAQYLAPVPVQGGAPACTAASGTGSIGGAELVSGSSRVWLWWVGGGVLLLALLALALFLLKRRRTAGAAALLLLVALGAVSVPASPARATIRADGGTSAAFETCMGVFGAPGGDPSGILSTLDDPSVSVQVIFSTGGGNGEYRLNPHTIFVPWNPNDTTPLSGGVPRDPCDELYHELYHAFEDTTPQGVDLHECITADGPSGISIKEVNATRAENALRAARHHDQRPQYGPNALPEGECQPPAPDAPLCHPTHGCPAHDQPPPAATTADPHLTTFDGRRYDFQGAGEFVLARDTKASGRDGFAIQVRQEPWRGSRYVAVNTVVAAQIGADRVQVSVADNQLALLVNGAATPVAEGALPGGGARHVSAYRGTQVLTLDWPDGSYLQLLPYAGVTLTVRVWVTPQRAGTMTGLLGDRDGDRANDPPPTRNPVGPEYDDLYPAFADSLRVSPATSLFRYASGTGPETYADRTFPDRIPPGGAADVRSNQAWAEALCRRLGVTEPVSLANCVLDVASTGQADFAAAALAAQAAAGQFGQAGGEVEPGDVESGQLTLDGPAVTATVSQAGGTTELSFTGRKGQGVYLELSDATIPDGCGWVRLRHDNVTVAIGCVQRGSGYVDRVVLPADGPYQVVVDPAGDATGRVRVRAITTADQTGTITPDGPQVAVSLTKPGSVASLGFTATKGQVFYVSATASTFPTTCGLLELHGPNGTVSIGCTNGATGAIDRTVIGETGGYALIVDPSDAVTGQIQVRLIEARDQGGTIAVNGPAVTAKVEQPGAIARFTFTVTANQRVSVNVTQATVTGCGVLRLDGPNGSTRAIGCVSGGTGGIDPVTLADAGTYAVVLDPTGADTGMARLQLVR